MTNGASKPCWICVAADTARKTGGGKETKGANFASFARATDIRMRAEIRAGELLAEMKVRGERDQGKATKGSRVATPTSLPKLSDIGVSKTQ